MKKSIKITIKGKVHSVWFRISTKEQADKIGILGTVQNINDGSVLVIAQAEEDLLNEFLKYCHNGPPLSKVIDVTIDELNIQDFSSFDILR